MNLYRGRRVGLGVRFHLSFYFVAVALVHSGFFKDWVVVCLQSCFLFRVKFEWIDNGQFQSGELS